MSPRDNSGMTLIEVLITLAVSMVSVSAFLYMALGNRTHKSRIDHSVLLKEVLTNNVIEVRGRAFRDLPPLGSCLHRVYNLQGAFQREEQVSGTGDFCEIESPPPGNIQIIWSSARALGADVNFDSPSLQVPSQSDLLRKVTVHVRASNRGNDQQVIHRSMMVFKK